MAIYTNNLYASTINTDGITTAGNINMTGSGTLTMTSANINAVGIIAVDIISPYAT